MVSVILLLSITLGALLIAGPGINLNFDRDRNISLPNIGNFFAGTEADDATLGVSTGDVEENNIGGAENRTWNMLLASERRANTIKSDTMEWAVREISIRTNGVINIEHFPDGRLGSRELVMEDVMSGSIEMVLGFIPVWEDSRGILISLPHLVKCYEDGMTIFAYGSNTFAVFNEIAEDNNLKLMGILPGELIGIGTTSQFNPETVWDFDQPSYELLIRVLPVWIFETVADAMRLRTIGIEERSEMVTALVEGDIDGWLGGSPGENLRYSSVINYFYDFKSITTFDKIFINRDIYYSIPENYRRIIFEVMQEASIRAAESQAASNVRSLQAMRDRGITVFVPTDEEREQMREAMIRRHWPIFADEFEIGQDLIDRILEDIR